MKTSITYLQNFITAFFLMVLLLAAGAVHAAAAPQTWNGLGPGTHVLPDKEWTVEFSQPVDPASVNRNTVYVTLNPSGERQFGDPFIPIPQVSDSGRRITVRPPAGGWPAGNTYYLFLTRDIRSREGGQLLEPYLRMRFRVMGTELADPFLWVSFLREGDPLSDFPAFARLKGPTGGLSWHPVSNWLTALPTELPDAGHYEYEAVLAGSDASPMHTLVVARSLEDVEGFELEEVEVGDNRVTLDWHHPQKDRMSQPILLYRERGAPASLPWTLAQTTLRRPLTWRDTRVTVTGLSPETRYVFRLAFFHELGSWISGPSQELDLTTTFTDETGFRLISFRPEEMEMTWQPPAGFPNATVRIELFERVWDNPPVRNSLGTVASIPASEGSWTFDPLLEGFSGDDALNFTDQSYDLQLTFRSGAMEIGRSDFLPLPENPALHDGDFHVLRTNSLITGMTVTGDLVIHESLGDGRVWLQDLEVAGDLVVRGGGSHTISLRRVTVDGSLLVDRPGGSVALVTQEGTEISGGTTLSTPARLENQRSDFQAADAFGDVVVEDSPQQPGGKTVFSGIFDSIVSHAHFHDLELKPGSKVGSLLMLGQNSELQGGDMADTLREIRYSEAELAVPLGTSEDGVSSLLQDQRPVEQRLNQGVWMPLDVDWSVDAGYNPEVIGLYSATGSFVVDGKTYQISVPLRITAELQQVFASGIARTGSILTASLNPTDATASFQWQRSRVGWPDRFDNIPGATDEQYTITGIDYGRKLRVVATGTGLYTGQVTSDPTFEVEAGLLQDIQLAMPVPVLGEAPPRAATIQETNEHEGFVVEVVDWRAEEGSLEPWMLEDFAPGGRFRAETIYQATLSLMSTNGWKFPDPNSSNVSLVINPDETGSGIDADLKEVTGGDMVGNRAEFTVTFDPTGGLEIREIRVVQQPEELTYTTVTGSALSMNLSLKGLEIEETGNDGSTRRVRFDENGKPFLDVDTPLIPNPYTTDPEHNTGLTVEDHHEQPVVITREPQVGTGEGPLTTETLPLRVLE